MSNKKIIGNYRKSLEQKYNAVCFDIDGTLTKPSSKEIDSRAIEMIADLLKRKIPIVFITGRGETGLKEFVDEVIPKLRGQNSISENDLLRMYALVNDGAKLYLTTDKSAKHIFNSSTFISTMEHFDELLHFNNIIIEELKNRALTEKCKITYSIDQKSNIILNIRLVFSCSNEIIIDSIVELVDTIIKDGNMSRLNVTRGLFGENVVIQIGTANKEVAIIEAEKLIGVPQDSMLRIGDCGDEKGNDYSMLNCQQGYSVDRVSGKEDSCFPIFDDENNILHGVEATLFLIKKCKLLPTVCLERANKYDYLKNYAQVEKDILRGRNKHLQKFDKLINSNFDLTNGVFDLFDASTGSIMIPMYEWELIDDSNPLKLLWNAKENDNLIYSLRDNNNYLLRGSTTYYYFLAHRQSFENHDYTTSTNVQEWYCNNIIFMTKALNALCNTDNLDDLNNKKMILGVLDNIRNILLVLLNHELISKYPTDNLHINLNSMDNVQIKKIYDMLIINNSLIANICFCDKTEFDIFKIQALIFDMVVMLKNNLNYFNLSAQDIDYSKEYRAYREIDNFAENYITIMLDVEKNKKIGSFGVCGMCYGGIELPIIYKIIKPELEDVCLLMFNKQVSGYKNKQLVELRKFNIDSYGGLKEVGRPKCDRYIVLDDNLLTGKTMQLALNCMHDLGKDIVNINVVRYPSVNRIDQMFMNNPGAVDYRLFFDYVTGLCFPSPYSWRDENELDPYKDSLGVFDLNRKKIIECLIKNHNYAVNSEVYEYKRRVLK